MEQHFPEGERVAVLTTQPLDRVLDYKAPAGGVRSGQIVEVPLGPRKVPGVVWGEGEGLLDDRGRAALHASDSALTMAYGAVASNTREPRTSTETTLPIDWMRMVTRYVETNWPSFLPAAISAQPTLRPPM